MLYLRFSNTAGTITRHGPYSALRIGGNFMRTTEQLRVVAEYHRHCWHLEGRAYTRYECDDPVIIRFENSEGLHSEQVGPIGRHFAADGTLYTEDALFARFHDETQLWQYYATETYWPILLLESARPS